MPRASLILSERHAGEGETITVSVQVENIDEAFSGASFALDYPVEALRLESPADHTPGAVVGGDALLLWNLAPAQNDFSAQSGSISFGASSSASWPGSSSGGVLANLTFTVAAGASTAPLWEISLRDVEISTDSGFEIRSASAAEAIFIGQAMTFAAWQVAHFDQAELKDATISGADSDPDGDLLDNAVEYFKGSDPNSPDNQPILSAELIPAADGDGPHCVIATYTRSITAVEVNATLQVSDDLSAWRDVTATGTVTTDLERSSETVSNNLITDGEQHYLRLRISL